MIKGITVNGRHSFHSLGLRMLKRSIGSPPKDDHTDRVPYSNITYDFDSVFGSSSYSERVLNYKFDFTETRLKIAECRLMDILNWLHWTGRKSLCDDMMPSHHFEVREPKVIWSENHGVYTFDVTFSASPEILSNTTDEGVI